MLRTRVAFVAGGVVAAGALAVGLAVGPGTTPELGPVQPVANPIVGGTVDISPAANPFFKADGSISACASGQAGENGHLGVTAHISAVTIPSQLTTALEVWFPDTSGHMVLLNPGNEWEADLSNAQTLPCSGLTGNSYRYQVIAKTALNTQDGQTNNRTYPISLVD